MSMEADAALRRLTGLDDMSRARVKYRMLKASLPAYAAEVLRGPEEYGGRFLLGEHHMEWGRIVNRQSRILAIAARDHGKSFFWNFAYPLWQVQIHSPGSEGVIFSGSDDLAKAHLKKIVDEVCGDGNRPPNPKLADLLPLRKNREKHVIFANGSSIKAKGFSTRSRGGHPKWIVGDDMLGDETIWSELLRSKDIDYFLSAIEPMPIPVHLGGQLIVVGTPFHARDLYKVLEETGEYHVSRHPCHDGNWNPLWAARYNRADLERKKRILASEIRWSREFMCQPITDDASIFPSWLFEQEGVKQNYALGVPPKVWKEQGFSLYMGVDLAISTSARADWFVMFTIAVCPRTGDVWIVDIYRAQGVGYQEQVDLITGMAQQYDCEFVFVEANQYQRVITDMVVRSSTVPVKAFYTTGRGGSKQATTQRRGVKGTYSANKNDLDRGVPAMRMLFENRKIRIPWAESTREKVQLWIGELQAYSFVQGKLTGVGAHDDTVMAFWMAERAASMGNMGSVYWDENSKPEDGNVVPSPLGGYVPATTAVGDNRVEDEAAPDFFGFRATPRSLPGLGPILSGDEFG